MQTLYVRLVRQVSFGRSSEPPLLPSFVPPCLAMPAFPLCRQYPNHPAESCALASAAHRAARSARIAQETAMSAPFPNYEMKENASPQRLRAIAGNPPRHEVPGAWPLHWFKDLQS